MYEKLLNALSQVQEQVTRLSENVDGAYIDVEGCHKQKESFITMDSMSMDRSSEVLYLRHDQRVVISAPEVVIGNVTRDGLLMTSAGSSVSIRSNEVMLNGVGDGGRVETKAPVILDLAVDPGIDGVENRVCDNSAVISHARKISLESSNSLATRHRVADGLGRGLSLKSDSQLSIDASRCNATLAADINEIKAQVTAEKNSVRAAVDAQVRVLNEIVDAIQTFHLDKNNDYSNLMFTFRSADVEALHANIEKLLNDYALELKIYFDLVSRLCELNYQEMALEADSDAVDTADAYEKSTDCSVTLNAESVVVSNFDGDGTFRNNKGAGFSVLSNKIQFSDNQLGAEIQTDSLFSVNSSDISLTGFSNKLEARKLEQKSVGAITLNSKTINMRSTDYEVEGEEIKETALTAESSVLIRSAAVNIESTTSNDNREKSSTGSITLTAKDIQVRSMDLDANGAESAIAAEGSVAVIAKNVVVGGRNLDGSLSDSVSILADGVVVNSKTRSDITSAESKAVINLTSSGMKLMSSATQISSEDELTLSGKSVQLNGPVKADSIEVASAKVSSSFVGPNIKDGSFKATSAAGVKPDAAESKEEIKPVVVTDEEYEYFGF